MKKQKKNASSSESNQTQTTTPTTNTLTSNHHHALTINNLASLNLNHVPQLQPRTDSIIDHSVNSGGYLSNLNSNFLLGLSNRSLLNLNAAANNFNVSRTP